MPPNCRERLGDLLHSVLVPGLEASALGDVTEAAFPELFTAQGVARLHIASDWLHMLLSQPDVPSSSCCHKCQATIGVQNQVVDPPSVHIRDGLKSRGGTQSSEMLM